MQQLCSVATAVKSSRDSHRQTTLVQELKGVADKFIGKFRLPLNPALLVKGIDIEVQSSLLLKMCTHDTVSSLTCSLVPSSIPTQFL